jgi:hypothetical protein
MVEHGGDRHRSGPRSRLIGAAAAALSVVLAGCSGGSEDTAGDQAGGTAGDTTAAACPAPSAAPAAEIALLPKGLSFDQIGTVTHAQHAAGHFTVQAVTTKPLNEVTVLIQDAVTAAGYRPAGMDNEGDEAEVFFTYGSLAAGQARLERAECAGQWDIDLDLIDPRTAPSPTASPTSSVRRAVPPAGATSLRSGGG